MARKPSRTGSAMAPFKALRTLGQAPVTLPMEPRPASATYRGFHLNDWDQCIGCGTCAEICDNRAISMVHLPELPEDPERGIRPRRPAVDYGRCCWCALCVDMCPTGALALSREYVHVSPDVDTFFILPDADGILRRYHLVLGHDGAVYPSLALEMARLYLLAEGVATVGSEIQDGYPEFTMQMLMDLGWDGDLTDEERATFQKLNADYVARHGFPFIIAVKDNTRATILDAFHRRIQNDRDTEFAEACRQVERIAELRLIEKLGA